MGGGDAGDVSDFEVSSLVSDFLISNVFCGEYEGVIDSPYEYLRERKIKQLLFFPTISINSIYVNVYFRTNLFNTSNALMSLRSILTRPKKSCLIAMKQ